MKNLVRSLFIALFSILSSTLLWAEEDPDVIEFAIITDTHGYGTTADLRYANANVSAFVKYCGEHPSLKFALFGGDFMNDYDTNHSQAMWCLNHARQDFSALQIPFYTTKGNHDCNGKQKKADRTPDNTQIITDREYYDLFSPLSSTNPLADPTGIVTDEDNPYGNYYYRDFESNKVRLIVLNNYDLDSLEIYGYHGKQMKWIAEKALDFSTKDDPTKWCILMLGHAFSISYNNNPLTRLMHAYVEGSDFTDTDSGVTYHGKYNRPRAQIAAMLSGHFHYSMYNNTEGYNMIRFDRGFATGGEVNSDNISFSHLILNTRLKTLEEKHIGRGRSRFFRYDHPTQVYPTMAFPEADGMGAEVSGGREGRTLYVTNLNNDGKGSLRWALDQQGCRTICFNVSGTIRLKSPLVIKNDSITIAGQSAPGNGIILEGAPLQIHASEVIIRYLKINSGRRRIKEEEKVAALSDGSFGNKNIMIDHMTFNWNRGSAISIHHAENVSVQFCRMELQNIDSLLTSPAIEAGGFKATYHHNIIINWPNAVHFPDEPGCNRWIHFVRNVGINWGDHAMYGGGNQGEITIEDNYFIPGPQTRNMHVLDVANDGTGRYYVKSNSIKGLEQYDRNNRALVNDCAGLPFDTLSLDPVLRSSINPIVRPQPIGFAASCITIAAFHSRSMFHSPSHVATLLRLQKEAGSDYRPQPFAKAPLDTDMDGLPDEWEVEYGLDKNDPNDAHALKEGQDYTNIELYLNDLVKPDKTIILLYDNDTYGEYDCYPYLAGYRNIVAADSAYVGIISNGNCLSGSSAADETSGQIIAEMRRRVGYDAINIGPADMAYPYLHLNALLKGIQAPVTSANLFCEDQEMPYAPYVIHKYGRKRVAFIGVSKYQFAGASPLLIDYPDQVPTYFLSGDIKNLVQRAADQARQSGADYVILLSQLGDADNSDYIDADALVSATHGIDAVINGSTQKVAVSRYVNNDAGKAILVSSIGSGFKQFGKMTISTDGSISNIVLPADHFHYKDPATAAVCDSIARFIPINK